MSAVVLVAFVLARLVPPAWAAATWVLAAALLLPPIEPWFAQVKGLTLSLAVLWLLPRLGTDWSGVGTANPDKPVDIRVRVGHLPRWSAQATLRISRSGQHRTHATTGTATCASGHPSGGGNGVRCPCPRHPAEARHPTAGRRPECQPSRFL